jgi:hypothetical protein
VLNLKTSSFICRRKKTVTQNKRKKVVQCNFYKSIFKGTFFENSHLPVLKIVLFMKVLVKKSMNLEDLKEELQISLHTLVDWKSFCREVCINSLITDKPLGGIDSIVEIDESKFGRRKYNRGRLVEGT